MKIILLDFIYHAFFKFLKYNKLNLRKKKLRFKRLLSFKFLMQTYSFIFLPLDMDIYYNNLYLLKNLKIGKTYLDDLLVNIFFGYNINLSSDLNLNWSQITKKISLDNLLFNNLDYYLNLFIFYITRKIGKYFFSNFISQYKGLNIFLLRILNFKSKLDNYSNYYEVKDTHNLVFSRYFDFNLSKHLGVNYFFTYRGRYLGEYL